MALTELLPSAGNCTPKSRHLFQRKAGSILLASIITRPDVSFAASRLARMGQNPNDEHHVAADRVIGYLVNIKGLAIRYGEDQGLRSLICVATPRSGTTPSTERAPRGTPSCCSGVPYLEGKQARDRHHQVEARGYLQPLATAGVQEEGK